MNRSQGPRLMRAGARVIVLPAVGLIVGALVAAVVSLAMPKSYRAEASVIIVPAQSPLTGQVQLSDVTLAQTLVTSVSLLAESPEVAATTAAQTGAPVEDVNGQLKGSIHIGTTIVTVQATAPTPAGAAAMATAAAQATAARAADLHLGGETIKINTLDQAIVPTTPASARPLFIVALGAFLGMLVGIGAYVLQRHFGDRFHRVAEVEQDLGMTALAVLPVGTSAQSTLPADQLYNDREMGAAVDALVAALSVRGPRGGRRILVTGAGDDQGAALVTSLLAVALRHHDLGASVLDAVFSDGPVDGSVLNGPLRAEGDVGHDEPGIVTTVPGREDVLDPDHRALAGYRVSQFGPVIDKRAAEGADVIVGTPPVLGGPAFAELAAHADVVLLVVDTDHVRRMDAVRAAQLIRQLDVDVTGLVVVGAAADDDRWLAPETTEHRT